MSPRGERIPDRLRYLRHPLRYRRFPNVWYFSSRYPSIPCPSLPIDRTFDKRKKIDKKWKNQYSIENWLSILVFLLLLVWLEMQNSPQPFALFNTRSCRPPLSPRVPQTIIVTCAFLDLSAPNATDKLRIYSRTLLGGTKYHHRVSRARSLLLHCSTVDVHYIYISEGFAPPFSPYVRNSTLSGVFFYFWNHWG